MENVEANVLSLDVTLLAITLETCIFQKDPGRSTEEKINSAPIYNYKAYPDHTSAYQLKSKHSIPPNLKPPDPPQIILKPHLFYTEEVKTKNYIDHISCFAFTKQRINSVRINNNYIESLVLPVFLPQYFNNQQKLVCLHRNSIHSIAPGKTVSKLKKARKRIRYFDYGRAIYTRDLDYTPSELISQWQYDRNPSSGWQPETMQTSKQYLDGWMFGTGVVWHKKKIGENRHWLLLYATRPVVGATQKITSNLCACLNERPWPFPITREVLITYSNLFISAVPTTSSFFFFLPAQSVAYEQTRSNHANLFSSRYLDRGRCHHLVASDVSLLSLSNFQLVELFASIDSYQASEVFVIAERYHQESGLTH
ncbi:hypothetical protein MJO28_002307 [Puccinia striiformis f. sp. tritici]|uniref:Uncharacterized protein n=1 Tax=Puccinia striiformis f. sp. tritici TaxID=168172 RepID=A0ACC0EYC7_9BASI|nr:hypothetical protein MJO28_002307 [Puccinia striiformis f. sp. tritici]